MKRKIKVAILLMFALLYGCSENESPEIEEPKQIRQREVTFTDIPDVVSSLKGQLDLFGSKENRLSVNNGDLSSQLDIDWDKIVELIDTTGNINYTFSVKDPDNAPYVFHNLVIGKREDGTFKRPFLLTYDMNDDFRLEYDATGSIDHFRGTISKRYFAEGLIGHGGLSANLEIDNVRSTVDENDPCNGNTTIDGDNSSPGGPGNLPSNDDDPSGGSNDPGLPHALDAITCNTYWYYPPEEPNGTLPDGSPIVYGYRPVVRWECEYGGGSSVAQDNNPCPDSEDLIAVIDPNTRRPCNGDVIKNPEVAATPAGKKGGTYGNTRKYANGNPKPHDGIDIKADPGTPVFPMHPGVILNKRDTFYPGEQNADKAYGNFVIVKTTLSNGEVIYLRYNHLQAVTTLEIGDQVNLGVPIGTSGVTGNAGGQGVTPHVHVLARKMVNGQWTAVNPANYMHTQVFADGSTFTPYPCIDF